MHELHSPKGMLVPQPGVAQLLPDSALSRPYRRTVQELEGRELLPKPALLAG
jgi:hypothetical protein